MKFTIEELRTLSILEDLPEKLIGWLSDNGTRIELAVQDHMFTNSQPADYMFIVVQGKIERYQEINGQSIVAATTVQGQVTGMLPYSRMTHYPGNAVAAEPSQVLRIDKREFGKMLIVSHEFGQRLVAEMSNRVRGDVRLEQQWEKMASLGKLSAGLAHELNNPVAAIRSTATSLKEQLADQTAFIMNRARGNLDEEIIEALLRFSRLAKEKDSTDLSPLQKSEEEEIVSNWLETQNIANAWKLANVFSMAGLSVKDLEQFSETVPTALLSDALIWISGVIEIDRKVGEISYAAGRVSELVSLVKNYSHMDQSSRHKPTDIAEGIENTLKIFNHKLNQKNIKVIEQYTKDLPMIPGNAGELNQVWTYIIDNAIDAMTDNGKLCIEIECNNLNIDVKIIDDGKGIPEDIRHRIFDPFFTTKGVGEGTGLGLDIARRIIQTHRGQIDVNSQPGRTEMLVRLPISPSKT
jgi:signal transduction histidine kinase